MQSAVAVLAGPLANSRSRVVIHSFWFTDARIDPLNEL